MANTLYDYYKGLGQSLPSVQERAKLYETSGLGTGYQGTAQQNASLLGYLQQTPTIPATTQQTASSVAVPKVLESNLSDKTMPPTGVSSPVKTATQTLQAWDSNTGKQIWVQPGVYTPGASLTKPVNSGIVDSSLLKEEKPLELAKIEPTSTLDADTALAGYGVDAKANDELLKYYQELLTPKESDLSKQVSQLLGKISTGAESLTGRGAAQLEAEEKLGIQTISQALGNKNTELKRKMAEINALTASYENLNQQESAKPILSAIIGGRQSILARDYAAKKNMLTADAGLIQAELLGLQGSLESAQNAANRAVDLMYADRESSYNAKLKQLEILQPQLEKEEARYADAMKLVLQQQMTKMADEKQEKKDIQNLKLEAIKAGITDQNILSQIGNAKTANEAMQILGVNMPSQDKSLVIDLATKYADAGITLSDTLAQAQAKLKNSRIYQEQVRGPVGSGGGGTGTTTSPQVESWVKLINSGQAKITSVPAALKNAVAMSLSAGQAASMTQSGYDIISSVNSLLNSNTNAITGVGQSPLTMLGITNQATINNYNQLKGLLALDNRQKLKGSGSISDFESKTLAQAASRLSRSLSNTAFRQELSRIQGTLLTASGNEAMVKITDPKTKQSQIVMATRQGIEAALKDGLDVQYQ